jgi:hypothetical protein
MYPAVTAAEVPARSAKYRTRPDNSVRGAGTSAEQERVSPPAGGSAAAAADPGYSDGSPPASLIDHVIRSGFPWPVF